MKLYVFIEDEKDTRFLFKDVSMEYDNEKHSITFHPTYCGADLDLFEAVKNALIDYTLPF